MASVATAAAATRREVRLYRAAFLVESLERHCLQFTRDALLAVDAASGVVVLRASSQLAPEEIDQLLESHGVTAVSPVVDLGRRWLVPGFVDTHTHAPQYVNIARGLNLPLLTWLQTLTFPTERKCADVQYARAVYEKCVRRHLLNGTTTACFYGTIHVPASKVLADITKHFGMRAYIGKVCMDVHGYEEYQEASAAASLQDTENFIQQVLDMRSAITQPIITPRFAVTCTRELMTGLGALAKQYDLPIQTHISENKREVAFVRTLFPEHESYTHVYDAHDLLTSRTILAHAVWLSEEEIELVKKRGTSISHCPNSNITISSGIMDARTMLEKGVKLSLGTDVSGGYAASMIDAMRLAFISSQVHVFKERESMADEDQCKRVPLSIAEVFYLATLAGAEALGMQDRIGNLQVGKEFDALVIDPYADNSPFDVFPEDTWEDIFQRFIMCGDDRNISDRYVKGSRIVLDANIAT